ncbi:MAG: hypothetical protein K8R86_09725 [Bacteroidales bacterium]|nr:hypothetical protein [Bacteroidales bacterium]
MKKVLVVYYSQTGQAKEIADSVINPLKSEFEITFEKLKSKEPYPFPWKGMSFFQVLPESVKEIPCEFEPFGFDPDKNFDLIILAFQVWYLSPSIPISSFLQTQEAKKVVQGKPVITIQGNRNMWVMSQERIKKRIYDLGGNLVGNIVLTDKNPNLVSVITITRWMMKGKKHGDGLYGKLFPPAGISEKDIIKSEKLGKVILDSFRENDLSGLQKRLVDMGAVKINPVLASIEKRGLKIFNIWANLILKKGSYGDKKRERRLKFFKYYLFAVIYLISPIVSLLFYIFFAINPRYKNKLVEYYSSNAIKFN